MSPVLSFGPVQCHMQLVDRLLKQEQKSDSPQMVNLYTAPLSSKPVSFKYCRLGDSCIKQAFK